MESGRTSQRTQSDPLDDEGRLAAVYRYDILDTPPDGALDRITAFAAQIFEVPIAIVSIVDHDRIWFKSHHGLDLQQIPREPGLCSSAILHPQPWVVTDAKTDLRALANPLVAGEFGLRFYVGVPLRSTDGHGLGTLCVIAREPKAASDAQVQQLSRLAELVMDQLELRLCARRAVDELKQTTALLRLISKEIDHRVMNSLQIVASLLSVQSRQTEDAAAADHLKLAANRVMTVAQVHRHFYIEREISTTRFLEFLERLCTDLKRILQFDEISVRGAEAEIATPRVVPLALVVSELITSCVQRGATSVSVGFEPASQGGFRLEIRDDGPGLQFDHEVKPGAFGMTVVRALTQQIKASISNHDGLDGRGSGFTIQFA